MEEGRNPNKNHPKRKLQSSQQKKILAASSISQNEVKIFYNNKISSAFAFDILYNRYLYLSRAAQKGTVLKWKISPSLEICSLALRSGNMYKHCILTRRTPMGLDNTPNTTPAFQASATPNPSQTTVGGFAAIEKAGLGAAKAVITFLGLAPGPGPKQP